MSHTTTSTLVQDQDARCKQAAQARPEIRTGQQPSAIFIDYDTKYVVLTCGQVFNVRVG